MQIIFLLIAVLAVCEAKQVLPSRFLSLLMRGGSSTEAEAESAAATEPSTAAAGAPQSYTVMVTSSFGSPFLDKKKKLSVPENSTVAELKRLIEKKYPGSPPVAIQRLYFASRYLREEDVVSNLTLLQPIPILLDTITGTAGYNRTLSVAQAIDAYTSSVVQQAYLGDKFRALLSNSPEEGVDMTKTTTKTNTTADEEEEEEEEEESPQMDTLLYRRMYDSVSKGLHEKFAADIAEALLAEMEPETFTSETIAWRGQNKRRSSPLVEAIAKEFDLNGRGLCSFLYYSAVLAVFAVFGTNSASSRITLLLSIPTLWVSKLRQVRLLSKLGLYLVLPALPRVDFLLPLLPATLQTIAHESSTWPSEWPSADGSL